MLHVSLDQAEEQMSALSARMDCAANWQVSSLRIVYCTTIIEFVTCLIDTNKALAG